MPRTYLVRHAKAGDRYKFPGPDRDRPLTPSGRRQAGLVAARLALAVKDSAGGLHLLSSPARRCIETIAPLAELLGTEIEVADWLEEGADVDAAFSRLRVPSGDVVACTHGDVIWGILEGLARDGVDLGDRPDAAKASTWTLEWPDAAEPGGATASAPRPDRALYHSPPHKGEGGKGGEDTK